MDKKIRYNSGKIKVKSIEKLKEEVNYYKP